MYMRPGSFINFQLNEKLMTSIIDYMVYKCMDYYRYGNYFWEENTILYANELTPVNTPTINCL